MPKALKMEFSDKYVSRSANAVKPDLTKTELSDDTFAIGELLDQIRVQLFRGNRNG